MIQRDALGGIQLVHRGLASLVQFLVHEVAAPGEDLQLALVRIVGVFAPGLAVGIRIEVVGAPDQHRQLMLPRTRLGDHLLLVAWLQR